MNQKLLKQYVNLAESLHFGKASELSHVSPSALSRNIRQIEAAVGVPLFERDNRSVSLTAAGAVFLDYARDAMQEWDALCNILMEHAGELRGEVSIYCSVTASYSFLFKLLSRFRRNYPLVEIKLHTGDPEDAVHRVMSGDEDIAIGARPDRLSAELAFRSIATTPLVFIAAKGSDALKTMRRARNSEHIWAQIPLILSEAGLARRRVDAWFRRRGILPNIYAQVAGNEAIVSMVSLGFGVGVVPRIVLDNSPLSGTVSIVNVQPALEAYDVGLFALEKRLKSPLINAFWTQQK